MIRKAGILYLLTHLCEQTIRVDQGAESKISPSCTVQIEEKIRCYLRNIRLEHGGIEHHVIPLQTAPRNRPSKLRYMEAHNVDGKAGLKEKVANIDAWAGRAPSLAVDAFDWVDAKGW